MSKVLYLGIATSLCVLSCKSEEKTTNEAQPQAASSDTSYGEALNEMKAACRTSPTFSHDGARNGSLIPNYTGFNANSPFNVTLTIRVTCNPSLSSEQITERVGAEYVDIIYQALSDWALEYNWFSDRSITAEFDENLAELASSSATDDMSWTMVFNTKGGGDIDVKLGSSDNLEVDDFKIIATTYTDEAITSGENIFNNRANDEGTCISCHSDGNTAPVLNGEYIKICSDDETVGVILNGAYSGSGQCSGDDLPEVDPHAFASMITDAEARSIIAWMRTQ
ncbi:c-type cytochrome [Pseudobacteriovorax antillogorgiicola]|uniref:Cytochrome c domain-containing protein n=1 Tax=Pseudobacteriovorax antillogorgiicola TaxID=1513793 RepID=A0A1Y6CKZ1_9BACT|nr:cytochrome c [Pseudobacteriovorax antillogorgiicola]TCS47580.1 hypothetical protein EDD56_12021 [Pseudobacteriovorax antillogorgiicola]SMF60376.1 hypothetical protein SAMN06296036_120119 [Pseudobacteriovorax antillogorgiicola]